MQVGGIIQQRFAEINGRINERLQEISSQTGMNFAYVLDNAVSTTNTAGVSSNSEAVQYLISEGMLNSDGEDLFANSLNRKTIEKVIGTVTKQTDYDQIIKQMSTKYDVSENLIRAVMKAESGFNPNVVSKSGAVGLMQLMPATAKSLGVTDSYDPQQNIEGGVKYLRQMLDKFNGNLKLAIAAYNCGPGRVSRNMLTNLDDPQQLSLLPSETQNYVKTVTKYMESGV